MAATRADPGMGYISVSRTIQTQTKRRLGEGRWASTYPSKRHCTIDGQSSCKRGEEHSACYRRKNSTIGLVQVQSS